MEELCRWRLWERTGGGLMAELGSHQLDAASIFISALRSDGKKAHPLTVHAVGGRHIFPWIAKRKITSTACSNSRPRLRAEISMPAIEDPYIGCA